MKLDDFRHMRHGLQLEALNDNDLKFLRPVHYSSEAKNRALLMFHGFSSTPAVFRYMLPHILHYDAIYCPPLPGHMESIEAFSRVKALDWVDAAEQHCNQLLQQYKKVDVLGLSLGGLLAYFVGGRFPVNHLYLLAPALKLHLSIQFALKFSRLCRFLGFCEIRNAAGTLMHHEHTEIAYRRLPIDTIREILILIHEMEPVSLQCPTDVFLGRHDVVVDSNKVFSIFENMPNTTIHWLNHSSHVLALDNDLQEIIHCINSQGHQALSQK